MTSTPTSLSSSSSTTTIAPVRQSPWSRLGSPLTVTPDLSDRDILARAGLDWRVGLRGIYTDAFNPLPDHRAIVRSDTSLALGVVGTDYQILQNDQLLGLLRCLAGQVPLRLETAGSFKLGAIVWFQARLPGLDIRVGDDVTHSYLLASSGHDGNRPCVLGLQGIRVVCQNTLALATAQVRANRQRTDLARGHVIRHTRGMPTALQDALATYRDAITSREATQAAFSHLASRPLTQRLEQDLLARVFAAEGPDESDRSAALRKAREERIQAILASPTSTVPGTAGSSFALLQAVVEYVDFHRPTRRSEGVEVDAQRMQSAVFGSGADLKQRAWSAILDLTGA